MQRRLDVAIGLVHRPEVLFLDEPTTGLDPEARADLWTEIDRLAAEEGLTILLTTHYLEEADRLASALAIVDRGRVVVEGSPDALKARAPRRRVHVELASRSATRAASRRRPARLPGVHEVVLDGHAVQRPRRRRRHRACPPCSPALESAGRARRLRRPSPVPRSTTSTCATRAAVRRRPNDRRAAR